MDILVSLNSLQGLELKCDFLFGFRFYAQFLLININVLNCLILDLFSSLGSSVKVLVQVAFALQHGFELAMILTTWAMALFR